MMILYVSVADLMTLMLIVVVAGLARPLLIECHHCVVVVVVVAVVAVAQAIFY